jgi:hypothetical protein
VQATSAVFHYQNFRFKTRIRGGLIALVYDCSLRTRAVDTGSVTSVALVGTDIERITESVALVHDLWGCLIDIPIGIWLLEKEMSVACIAPVVLLLSKFWPYLLHQLFEGAKRFTSLYWDHIQPYIGNKTIPSCLGGEGPGETQSHHQHAE